MKGVYCSGEKGEYPNGESEHQVMLYSQSHVAHRFPGQSFLFNNEARIIFDFGVTSAVESHLYYP